MFFRSSKALCLIILSGLLSFRCDPKEEPIVPVVEEGLFINEIYAAGDDWIELYNSLESSKDLGGYFIYDNEATKYKLPIGTSIPAKGFLILFCNDLGAGLNTNFKLTSGGETVYFENKAEVLIDRIEFPAISNGQSYGRYPDGSASLSVSGITTQGTSNGNSQTPAVLNTSRSPIVPGLNQSVIVSVNLVTNSGVATVKMYYRFNGGAYSALPMSLSGSTYVAALPAESTTGKMEYFIEVTGTNDNKSYEPASAPDKVLDYLLNTDQLPLLVINEFLANNISCCPDTDGGINEFDDWIEIYNKGTESVDIGGMYLSDNKSNPFKHKIPADNPSVTTITPGGYLLLWADNSSGQGQLHLDFALSNAGEDVGIFYIDGRTIDVYTFGAQSENVSFGRTTDGAVNWKSFNTPTPKSANQ